MVGKYAAHRDGKVIPKIEEDLARVDRLSSLLYRLSSKIDRAMCVDNLIIRRLIVGINEYGRKLTDEEKEIFSYKL